MQLTLKLFAWLAIPVVLAADTMLVEQQNAIIHKQCAFCHNDAQMQGGFSLDRFDAAHPDPSLVAMLISKLKVGAMGAGGFGVPDRATQDALLSALSAEATGASEWSVREEGPLLTAGIVRALPSMTYAGSTDMFRLRLTCNAGTREGEIQVAWAPGNPTEGRPMSVAVDGNAPLTVKAEGGEKQGNGKSGPGSVILPITLPAQTLTISNVFPDETVVFSLGDLPQTVRQCFKGGSLEKVRAQEH
jgi:hypothetical protein